MNKKVVLRSDDEDDDSIEVIGEDSLAYFERSIQLHCVEVPLDETIKLPRYYRKILQRMKSLTKHDQLNITVNTYGGSLDGAIALINGMQNTEATVTATLDGMAASAGSLIFLSAENVAVMPYSQMMIHQGSFGAFGSQTNVQKKSAFIDEQMRKLMREVYTNFLTPEELEDVFKGLEIWLDYEEIVRRLELRAEILQSQQGGDEDDQQPSMVT